MIKYQSDLNSHERIIRNYISELQNNENNNHIEDLILKRFHFIKDISDKYYYPDLLYYHVKDYVVSHNYIVKEDSLISCLNEYKKNNNYYYNYWEIKETLPVIYNILINEFSELINSNSINNEHEQNIISIIDSIEYINTYNIESILNKVYDVDRLLLDINEFKLLDSKARDEYRQAIVAKSKTAKMHEYLYTKKIIKKAFHNHKSISFFLFRRTNYKGISSLLLIISIILSIIISIIINKYIPFTCFMLFLFIYNILIRLVKNDYIPRYQYNRVPETSQVMLMKYVVLKNSDEVAEAFNDLEKIYLNYREDYIDYTLLIDTTECDHQIEPFDNEIVDQAISYTLGLNERYGKDTFHVLYRKRVKQNNSWYGLSRKEGAIKLFNELLLGTITDEDLENNFMCNSDFHKEYVYVVEVDDINHDVDIRELVGIMDHPFNKPVIKNNKVLRGYVCATNNGQNILGDSIYTGTGIYRLREYYEIMNDMDTCLLHYKLPRTYSINKGNKQVYNYESVMKNNLTLYNNGFFLNNIQKKKLKIELLGIVNDFIIMALLVFCIIRKDLYFMVLLYIVGNISTLFTRTIFNIKLLLSYIFSKNYKNNILENVKKYKILNIVFVIYLVVILVYMLINKYNLFTL